MIGNAFSAITGASRAKFMKCGRRDNTLSIVSEQVLNSDDVEELGGNSMTKCSKDSAY